MVRESSKVLKNYIQLSSFRVKIMQEIWLLLPLIILILGVFYIITKANNNDR